jgi:hypothetical protein
MFQVKFNSGFSKVFRSEEELCSYLRTDSSSLIYILKTKSFPENISDIKEMSSDKPPVVDIVKRMWVNINSRVNFSPDYRHVKVLMSQLEFFRWALPRIKEFCEKYPNETPSIDRIDPRGNYEIENIQILSRRENLSKQFDDKPEHREFMRRTAKEKFAKPVKIIMTDGTEKIFDSAEDADRAFGKHKGYTYWRLLKTEKRRKMPDEWQSVDFL